MVFNKQIAFCVHQKPESKMTDKKPSPESDDARSGDDADKNREQLSKAAEKGLKDARGNSPKGDAL